MTTTYGTSASTIRIGDASSNGTYEAYFNPQGLNIQIMNKPTTSNDVGDAQSIVVTDGALDISIRFKHMHTTQATDTPFINLKKMFDVWSRNNTPLYLTIDNGHSANLLTWPDEDLVMQTMFVKWLAMPIISMINDQITLQIILKRTTL